MIKNRVRTAALAGAVAVATGVSGLTVPANAEETPQISNHHNQADGSKAEGGQNKQNAPAVGAVKAADELRKAANADKTAIANHKFEDFIELDRRPIERDSYELAKAKEAEATALLNRAVSTLNDVDATVKSVQAELDAAEAAWKAYATAVALSPSEVKALQDLVAELKKDGADLSAIEAQVNGLNGFSTTFDNPTYYQDVAAARAQVEPLAKTIDEEYEKLVLDSKNEDKIDELNAVATVSKAFNGYLEGFDDRNKLYKKAVEATAAATGRNIAVLKEALGVAKANVRAARTLQAYYTNAARWLDLYELDTLTTNEESTLREQYRNLLFGAVDLKNKAAAAVALGDSDLSWEGEVSRVQLMDKKYRTDFATEEAVKRAQEVERKTPEQQIADALTKQDENLKDAPKDPSAPGSDTPAPGKNEGLKGTTIAAIVIGVLAALGGIVAVAFPHIQQFLPKF